MFSVLCACSLASQHKAAKQKMVSSKTTLQKRFDELKKETGAGTATGTRHSRELELITNHMTSV